MMGFYVFKIVGRYFVSKKSPLFSIAATAIAVTAIVVVLSVMNGFLHELERVIQGTTSHLEIRSRTLEPIAGYDSLRSRLLTHDEVVGVAPRFQGTGILVLKKGDSVVHKWCEFLGVVPEEEEKVGPFRENLVSNTPRALEGSQPWLVGGVRLLDHPHMDIGSTVAVVTSAGYGRFKRVNFAVAGYFRSGLYEFDNRVVFLPVAAAQELAGSPGLVNVIAVRLRDPAKAASVAKRLEAALGPEFLVRTWRDTQKNVLVSVELERNLLFIILLVLLLLSSFLISALLVMMVHQRTRDIGILRGMGGRKWGVGMVYLFYGACVGGAGAAVGILASLVILRSLGAIERGLSSLFGFPIWNPELYRFDRIPVEISASVVSAVAGLAVALSIAASFYPALRAARLVPVEAIRYE